MSLEVLRPNDFPDGSNRVFKDVVINQQEAVVVIEGEQKGIKERLTAVEEKNGEQDIAIEQNKVNIAANTQKNIEQDVEIKANADKNDDQDILIQANKAKNDEQDGLISNNTTNIESIKEVLAAVNGSIVGDKDVATVDAAGLVKQVLEASIVGPLNPNEQDPAVIVAKINELAVAWSKFVRDAFVAGIIKTENNSEDYPE